MKSKLYCKSCVQHVGVESQSVLDSASKEQIQELEVVCPNSDKGCRWEGKLGEVKSHRSTCPKEMITCQFKDIGCDEVMLRDEADKHDKENKDQHLQCAILTITRMKQTDTSIRRQMKQLEGEFKRKIEELKQKYEGVIQRLKEEISICPPVVVSMTNLYRRDNLLTLSIFDIVRNGTFMSSGFYSHPQGYKLSAILKCSTEEVKIRVVALQQENPPPKWPCKGVAVITLQPEDKGALQFDIEFDIPKSTELHEIDEMGEEGYKVCSIPQVWYDDRQAQSSVVTLKIERINIE